MKKIVITAICAASALVVSIVLITAHKSSSTRNAHAEICEFTMNGTDYVCEGKVTTCLKGYTTSGSKYKCYGKAVPKGGNSGTPGLGGNPNM